MQKEGKKTAENTIFYIILGILPFLAALICLGIGRYSMSVSQTVTTLFSKFTNAKVDNTAYTVIFNVRLPRIILAAVVGAGLSCAGAAFQGLFSNPLATPDTLGVASGASFGAVLAMLIWRKYDRHTGNGTDLRPHLLSDHISDRAQQQTWQHCHDRACRSCGVLGV